jgi:hypothetical protein
MLGLNGASHRLSQLFVVLAVILGMTLLPSPLAPQLWEDPFPLPRLVPNEALSGSEKMGVVLVIAPESFAMGKNEVYAGLSYGAVVALSQNGTVLRVVVHIGEYLNNSRSQEWCRQMALANTLPWDWQMESECGRPLGLRLTKNNNLYVVDAYHGIFRVDVATGNVEHIVRPGMISPSSCSEEAVDPLALTEPLFYNDVEVDEAANFIYFTDSSYKHRRAQNRAEVIDGAPRGRLLAFDEAEGQLHVLLCGLHFPNGLQRLGSKLLLVESGRFRILAVDAERLLREQRASGRSAPALLKSCGERGSLKDALAADDQQQAAVHVYLSNLPGFPDNIRISSSSQHRRGHPLLLLCGLAAKSSQPFSLLWSVYQSVWARAVLGRLLPMKWVEKLIPRHGLVLVVSNPKALLDHRAKDGSVVAAEAPGVVTLQDSSGRLAFISEAQIHPRTGELWLGTHHNPTSLSILRRNLFHAGLDAALASGVVTKAKTAEPKAAVPRSAALAPSSFPHDGGAGGGGGMVLGEGFRKFAARINRLVGKVLQGSLRFVNAVFTLFFPPLRV